LLEARTIRLDANGETDREQLLDVLEARLSLLLQISRTREGAGYILDGGLLQAIRESMLFRADPDIGMGKEPIFLTLQEFLLINEYRCRQFQSPAQLLRAPLLCPASLGFNIF
jgi:Nuclear pore complex scaffold, nucleoporins 186/192/205